MLLTAVGILSPSSLGGGDYSLNLYFQNANLAQYVRIGDYLEDSTGNIYAVTTWSTYPSDFSSSGSITVHFVTTDVLPQVDAGYTSTFYTPDQEDVRPELRTSGTIGNVSLYLGQNYEYQMQASWLDAQEGSNAIEGDSIVDSDGKEFTISNLEGDKFSSFFRVTETDKEGIAPISGVASLFRPTDNYNFYQGSELSDPARTNIFNRDKLDIDILINQAMSSGGGATTYIYTNDSGGSILTGRVVRKSGATTINYADWDSHDDAAALGIALEDISNSASGDVQIGGVIPSGIITSACFTEASLPTEGVQHWIYLSSTDGKMSVSPPTEATGKAQIILGIWDNGKLILRVSSWGIA